MERNGGGPALCMALAAVCLLCGGASAAYSVPADPRSHPPSASPARAGHYHHAPAPSPHRRHHHHHGISPAPTPGSHHSLPSLPPVTVYSRPPEPQATTTPHFGFPLEPTVGVSAGGPSGAPKKAAGGEGYPFIGSNPTVPLPTGVTDTATVRPLSDTSRGGDDHAKVAGRAGEPVRRTGAAMIGLLLSTTVMLLLS